MSGKVHVSPPPLFRLPPVRYLLYSASLLSACTRKPPLCPTQTKYTLITTYLQVKSPDKSVALEPGDILAIGAESDAVYMHQAHLQWV